MALTALAIKNAKPNDRPYKLADARCLYLLIMPNGRKLWRLDYRHLDKRKTLALERGQKLALRTRGTR